MIFKEFITFLGTKDLRKTSNFYQHILGLTIYKDQGVCLIFNIINQSKIGFCEHMPVVYKGKSPIITLVTEDVDVIYNQLIKFVKNQVFTSNPILSSCGTVFDNIQNLVYSYPE